MATQVSRSWTGVMDTKWTPSRWPRAGVHAMHRAPWPHGLRIQTSRELGFGSIPGSQLLHVRASPTRYLDNSAGRPPRPYPPHSAGSCVPGGFSSWKQDRSGVQAQPRVEAEPHGFRHQFSGFSG